MGIQDNIRPTGDQLPQCANPECRKELPPGSQNTHCNKRCAGRALFLLHPERFKGPPIAQGLATVEELRLDVAWEARHGIANLVGCRECSAFVKTPLGQKKNGHLATYHPHLSVQQYRALYPGARLASFVYVANANVPRGGVADVKQLMAKFARRYVTGPELTACRTDMAEWEARREIKDFVVCRRCGFKASQLRGGTGHLGLHGWTVKDYQKEYPGAPTTSVERSAAERELSAKPEVKARRKLARGRWEEKYPLGRNVAQRKHYRKNKKQILASKRESREAGKAAKKLVLDLQAEIEVIRREKASEIAAKEAQIAAVKEKLSRPKVGETRAEEACRRIDAELPVFDRLFAARENIEALRKRLRSIDGFSKSHIDAAHRLFDRGTR